MDFDSIYEAYFHDVFSFLLRLCNDEHIAEEITSDTFFKAMRSIQDFRGDCEVRVWLCQIAKNSYYTYAKKHKKLLSLDSEELLQLAEPNSYIDEQLGKRESVEQIQKILHTLQEPYKEVFMWRVLADLSFKQIGEIFGKSDNWACVTYHRARKIIKSRMEELNREK